jgi:hypothetical protein
MSFQLTPIGTGKSPNDSAIKIVTTSRRSSNRFNERFDFGWLLPKSDRDGAGEGMQPPFFGISRTVSLPIVARCSRFAGCESPWPGATLQPTSVSPQHRGGEAGEPQVNQAKAKPSSFACTGSDSRRDRINDVTTSFDEPK